MDMETIKPRTCTACKGVGHMYFGNEEMYDVQPCDECNQTTTE